MDRNQLLNDPEETQRTILEGHQAGVWTAMPCIVTGVDLTEMTISAQPAIQGEVTDQTGAVQYVDYPQLIHVPICFPSGGGFLITFPLAVGDEVLVVFASRCIDAWWQSGGTQNIAMESRMHDLSDGFAIPGPRSIPNVPDAISATKLQIRNDAGTTYVEIDASGKIGLVSPSEIDITAPMVTVSGAMTVTGALIAASLATSGSGSATITGGINVTGAITAGSVTAGGIGLSTHKHAGVTTGGGTSGGPTP